MMKCELHLGDCLEVLKTLADNSIDLVLTDPPYGTTKCKWDSVVPLEPLWAELKRVAKPRAAVVMTASQPFTTQLISSNLKDFKYCWVWHKRTSANVGAARFQPLKVHEDVVVFGGVYRPLMKKGKMRMKGGKVSSGGKDAAHGKLKPINYKSDKYYPVSVLDIKTERGRHPTQKPVELMAYLVKTYTSKGQTVLDFTMGSGSTGVACIQEGRRFVGIEKDPTYFKAAKERLEATQEELLWGLFTGQHVKKGGE
mgnify:CR=1 FL=1